MAEIVDGKNEASGKRPNFPCEFKRQLAEQTFEPGASVSLVARRNDINTNPLTYCSDGVASISKAFSERHFRRMHNSNPMLTLHRYSRWA